MGFGCKVCFKTTIYYPSKVEVIKFACNSNIPFHRRENFVKGVMLRTWRNGPSAVPFSLDKDENPDFYTAVQGIDAAFL